jgi:hypothetical protein
MLLENFKGSNRALDLASLAEEGAVNIARLIYNVLSNLRSISYS